MKINIIDLDHQPEKTTAYCEYKNNQLVPITRNTPIRKFTIELFDLSEVIRFTKLKSKI